MIKNKKTIGISTLVATVVVGSVVYANSVLQKDVTLIVDGQETAMVTYTNNVQEFLEEQSVEYDDNDIVSLELDKELADGDVIEVIDVTVETITEAKIVEYTTSVEDDNTILKGETVVDTEGQDGENELVYTMTYHNGELVEKTFVEENVKTEPIDEIVKKGTKVEEVVVAVAPSRGETSREEETSVKEETSSNTTTNNTTSSNTTTSNNTASSNTTTNNTTSNNTASNNTASNNESSDKETSNNTASNSGSSNTVASSGTTMTVSSTAYSINGTTSTGTQTRWGVIAVDPKVIPYGTKVYIPEFDMTFIAEDTGGAIKGNIIDIYMPTREQAINWGRRTITIKIL